MTGFNEKSLYRISILRDCAAKGLSLPEAARRVDMKYHAARRLAGLAEIKFIVAPYRQKKPPGDREFRMGALFQGGMTLQEIGLTYGITRERVRQLLTKVGITADEGGQSVRTLRKKSALNLGRDRYCRAKYGCSHEQRRELVRVGAEMVRAGVSRNRTPYTAYKMQSYNARNRGIEWHLTLWQWWTIWKDSGCWEKRGRGQGYVMCRKGDMGPYAVGNVFIATAKENISESARIRRQLRETTVSMGSAP